MALWAGTQVWVIAIVCLFVVGGGGWWFSGSASRPNIAWLPDLDPAEALRIAGSSPLSVTDSTVNGTRTWSAEIAAMKNPEAMITYVSQVIGALRNQLAQHAEGPIEAWNDPRSPQLPILIYAKAKQSGRIEVRYHEISEKTAAITVLFTTSDYNPADLRTTP